MRPEGPGPQGDSLFFVGAATTLLRLGPFTVLTDPSFLRRGQCAHLGWGRCGRRLTDPALEPADLPVLDVVLLSHLRGDHFDRVARRHLDRTVPVVTTPHAARRLARWGFGTRPLGTWDDHVVTRGLHTLRITSVPAVHARGVGRRLPPPVMGSVVDHLVAGELRRRVYVTGDTLDGDHVDEVHARFPGIDAAVLHLGGRRLLRRATTMDGAAGVGFVERCHPSVVVPVHHEDYRVFRSPLSDFVDRAWDRDLVAELRCPERGDLVSLAPPVGD